LARRRSKIWLGRRGSWRKELQTNFTAFITLIVKHMNVFWGRTLDSLAIPLALHGCTYINSTDELILILGVTHGWTSMPSRGEKKDS